MKIWEVMADYDYRDTGFINVSRDWHIPTYQLKGELLRDDWNPVPVDIIEETDRQRGDFSTLATVPVAITDCAVQFLNDVCRDQVELLPLKCENCELDFIHIVNVINVVNCLDEDRSSLKRFESGKIMVIDEYVFQTHKLDHMAIFKIPQMLNSRQYVTDKFVDEYYNRDLKGLQFDLLN